VGEEMRTREKMRVFKKFMAGESVRDIAQARHLTIEEVEQVIRLKRRKYELRNRQHKTRQSYDFRGK
jgi:Mor family transcriptional regulator